MEKENSSTSFGNELNHVPLTRLHLESLPKAASYLRHIFTQLDFGFPFVITKFHFQFKRDRNVGLRVTIPFFLPHFRSNYKHACLNAPSLVSLSTDNTLLHRRTTTPYRHSHPYPNPRYQMSLNTSTLAVTPPSHTPPLNSSSEHYTPSDVLSFSPSTSPSPRNTTRLFIHNDTSTHPGFLPNSTKDDNTVIITSYVTSLSQNEMSSGNGSFTTTPGNDILKTGGRGGLSRNNIVLITSLSIVLGCFAFTALLLRIGSRVAKARKEAEERKRKRRHAIRRSQGKRSPQITIKQIRVRLEPDKRGKKANKSSIKPIQAHPNRLNLRQRQDREAETSFITLPDSSPRRTDDALLGIAACTTEVALGKGVVSSIKGESFTSQTELLDAFNRHKRKNLENEYDNPVMDVRDPDEENGHAQRTSTETETSFTSDTSNLPSWSNSPLHFRGDGMMRRSSSPERTSLPSITGEGRDVTRESSESGSNGEVHRRLKLMRMHGRRNSGNNSKDSGYAGGSFVSQDSSRNLLAHKGDPHKRDKFGSVVQKNTDSPRNIAPVILEMENETYPLGRLGQSHPRDFPPSRRYSLQLHPRHPYYHDNVVRTQSNPYYPHPARPMRPLMGSSTRTRRLPFDFYSRNPTRRDGYNEYPYIVDCPPIYVGNSYLGADAHGHQPRRSHRMTTNPIFRLPPQESLQNFPSYSYLSTSPHHQIALDDQTRFVKRRTASTQTPSDNSPETPPSSLPSSPSIVRWHREGRSFMLMPREDMDLDFIGPVYLAESMSESDVSFSDLTEPTLQPTSEETSQSLEKSRGTRNEDRETESDMASSSDCADDEVSTKVSSKDEDSIKDENALLLGDDGSDNLINDTKL